MTYKITKRNNQTITVEADHFQKEGFLRRLIYIFFDKEEVVDMYEEDDILSVEEI